VAYRHTVIAPPGTECLTESAKTREESTHRTLSFTVSVKRADFAPPLEVLPTRRVTAVTPIPPTLR
jgi:hypothetical protein